LIQRLSSDTSYAIFRPMSSAGPLGPKAALAKVSADRA
jgi:hypothetical protein